MMKNDAIPNAGSKKSMTADTTKCCQRPWLACRLDADQEEDDGERRAEPICNENYMCGRMILGR